MQQLLQRPLAMNDATQKYVAVHEDSISLSVACLWQQLPREGKLGEKFLTLCSRDKWEKKASFSLTTDGDGLLKRLTKEASFSRLK